MEPSDPQSTPYPVQGALRVPPLLREPPASLPVLEPVSESVSVSAWVPVSVEARAQAALHVASKSPSFGFPSDDASHLRTRSDPYAESCASLQREPLFLRDQVPESYPVHP